MSIVTTTLEPVLLDQPGKTDILYFTPAKNTVASFKISRSCSVRLSSRLRRATSACKSPSSSRVGAGRLYFFIQTYKHLVDTPSRTAPR